MHPDYLEKVLNAQVYDIAVETPLELAANLSSRAGNKILLKREDMQPVFSFKLRGAYNKIASLSPEKLKRGVICASAGNHAQGVACRPSCCRAVIVMPTSTPGIKIDAVKRRGGEVVLLATPSTTPTPTPRTGKSREADLRPSLRRPEVIAGQGTIGLEILRQHSRPTADPRRVLRHRRRRPGGGGGGLHQAPAPGVKVIGVETFDADAMKQSLAAGKRVRLHRSACSPTAPPSSWSARKPSACARNTSTK
jgi:threonine dehydratase